MLAEIGHYALILALAVALAQAVLPMAGAWAGHAGLMAAGRSAAAMQLLLISVSFSALMALFVTGDFSVALVAQHSHSTQPEIYRATATWGSHEGSLLLWVLILAVFGACLALSGGSLRETLRARVLGVQGAIGAAFLAFLLFTSNPFTRLSPAPADGQELNPLLQDPGLVVHPPLLYIGYVGFSVAFAFAVAALIEGRVDAAWARWVRPWVLAAWTSLTLGIALGSFWAYYELGWGGWWFWDPVENASLMPWLLGTALLHSALVLEKRGALISWTLLLAVLTFSLSLIGTFLVRSGILTSVHAFAVDPTRGVFVLAIIVGFTGAALALFAWRAPMMKSGALFGTVSREAGLTANNLFLLALAATVLLGTFYPVINDAIGADKISVGPPFYAATFVPIAVALLLLVSVGPMLTWRRDSLREVAARLRWPALAAAVALLAGAALAGAANLLAALGVALGVWLMAGAAAMLARRWRGQARLVRTTPAAVWGTAAAHLGLGVLVVGVAAMSAWRAEKTLVMRVGDRTEIAGRAVRLTDLAEVGGANYRAVRATFEIAGRVLSSERRLYDASGTQTTEAGIGAGIGGNDYVAIGEPQAGVNGIVVRLYRHPLVGWIWVGAAIMATGGLLSLSDRRFRLGLPTRAAPPLPAGMLPA